MLLFKTSPIVYLVKIMQSSRKILKNLIKLQRSYAFTFRAMVTEERYRNLVKKRKVKNYTLDSDFIREPLIEHTGHLPIIACYLHPLIWDPKQVNLNRVLTMLAVHDIAETVTGDVMTYKKEQTHEKTEYKITEKLLPDYLFEFFEEFKRRESLDAQFAKAVDSIAPLLHELSQEVVTRARFKHHQINTDMIEAKKTKHFEFDPQMKKLFAYVIEQFRRLEAGTKLDF